VKEGRRTKVRNDSEEGGRRGGEECDEDMEEDETREGIEKDIPKAPQCPSVVIVQGGVTSCTQRRGITAYTVRSERQGEI
jgi:hypothetical protein